MLASAFTSSTGHRTWCLHRAGTARDQYNALLSGPQSCGSSYSKTPGWKILAHSIHVEISDQSASCQTEQTSLVSPLTAQVDGSVGCTNAEADEGLGHTVMFSGAHLLQSVSGESCEIWATKTVDLQSLCQAVQIFAQEVACKLEASQDHLQENKEWSNFCVSTSVVDLRGRNIIII